MPPEIEPDPDTMEPAELREALRLARRTIQQLQDDMREQCEANGRAIRRLAENHAQRKTGN